MAQLVLNPNSIYKNSQANFILNKDALYAFTRSISSLNESIYGMQPTREQLLSGFVLSDVFEANPLSTNGSLCANVYVLDECVGALKFFASRPFVVCENVADRNSKAQNPLAVYLTPVVPKNSDSTSSDLSVDGESDAASALEENDCYEWIYVLSSIEGASDWDTVVSAYNAWQLSGDAFHLTSFPGKWELIGSTSLTDEKIAALFRDVNESIEDLKNGLSGEITADFSALSSAIEAEGNRRIESDKALDGKISALSSDTLSSIDATNSYIDEVSSSLCSTIDAVSSILTEEQDSLLRDVQDIRDTYLPLSGSKTVESNIAIRDYVKIVKDGIQTSYESMKIEILSSNGIVGEGGAAVGLGIKYPEDEFEAEEDKTFATREWTAKQIEDLDLQNALSVLSSEVLSEANSYTDAQIDGLSISLRLADLSDAIKDWAKGDELSGEIHSEIANEASRAISIENKISDSLSELSSAYEDTVSSLVEYVLKEDLKNKIEAELSDCNKYVDGTEPYPQTISALISWNAALHRALSAIANL